MLIMSSNVKQNYTKYYRDKDIKGMIVWSLLVRFPTTDDYSGLLMA